MGGPAPNLLPHLPQAVRDLAADLIAVAGGRERFAPATPGGLLVAAETFARYRLTKMPIIRQSDLMERRTFLSDLRELGRRPFPATQLIMHLVAHFAPMRTRSRANSKDPPYEEIVLPEKLRRYSPDLPALGASCIPNQLRDNFASRELVRGKAHGPRYTPDIAADVSAALGLCRLRNIRWLSPDGRTTGRRRKLISHKNFLSAPGSCAGSALSLHLTFSAIGFLSDGSLPI